MISFSVVLASFVAHGVSQLGDATPENICEHLVNLSSYFRI
jgi:hypothetical protein